MSGYTNKIPKVARVVPCWHCNNKLARVGQPCFICGAPNEPKEIMPMDECEDCKRKKPEGIACPWCSRGKP